MRKFLRDFKNFISKGNVLDMAIGIIIGTSFQNIVKSLANDILYPLISRMIGVDFTSLHVVLKPEVLDSEGEVVQEAILLSYGNLIQNVVDFLIIALAIFVGLRAITGVRNMYNYGRIKMLKKMKRDHPELFDDKGVDFIDMYNDLKAKYPEKFKEEIEKEKEEAEKNKVVEVTTNDILNEILVELKKQNNEK